MAGLACRADGADAPGELGAGGRGDGGESAAGRAGGDDSASPGQAGQDEAEVGAQGGMAGDPGLDGAGANRDPGQTGRDGGAAGMSQGGLGGTAGTAAGGVTGTGGGAAARPCSGGALACSDFEQWSKGARPGEPFSLLMSRGDVLTIDDARAFSGSKSVRIDGNGAGTTALTLSTRTLLPAGRKVGYARMMLFMEGRPGQSGHWDVMSLFGPAAGGGKTWLARYSFGGFGDDRMKLLYYANAPGGGLADCSKAGPPAIPLNRWVCVEMWVDETQPAHYTVRVDGVVVPGSAFRDRTANSVCCCGSNNDDTWYLPEIYSVRFGWTQVHAQQRPVRLWIDDVAVGDRPLGCPTR